MHSNAKTKQTQMNELEQLKRQKRLLYKDLLNSSLVDLAEDIASSINTTKARQIIYHIETSSIEIPKCPCGNNLPWHDDKHRYKDFCSRSCTAKYTVDRKKKKNLEKHGVEWHSQTKSWKNKVEKTSKQKYGKSHYSKTNSYKKSVKETTQKKYGVVHVMHLESAKQKQRQTSLDIYGFEHPSKSPDVIEKFKQTNLEKHGYENPFKSPLIREKYQKTFTQKYGVDHPSKVPSIIEKRSKTFKKNYYNPVTLKKVRNTNFLKYQNHILEKSVGEIAEDLNISPSNLGKIFNQLDIPIQKHSKSKPENRLIQEYNKNFQTIQNSQNVIPPKELDIFFPEHNLAVEINGIYYHSEKFGRNKNTHLEKYNQCLEKGITLLQFWDYEINDKFEIVKSMIDSKINNLNHTVYARNCAIRSLTTNEKRTFLENNHLQGNTNSKIDLGLFYQDNLIMVASFGKSRFSKKETQYEIHRLAAKTQTHIPGGAEKLIKHFVENFLSTDEKLITYSDKRYSHGNVYKKLNFTELKDSEPNFFYIDYSGKYLGTRYQFQKHLLKEKLSHFDPNKTATQNMIDHKCYRVWDCGNKKFQLQK